MPNVDMIAATEAEYEGVASLDYEEFGLDFQTGQRTTEDEQ